MWTVKTDQTGQMPRLIWVFAGHTCHFVGFVMRWLICPCCLPVRAQPRALRQGVFNFGSFQGEVFMLNFDFPIYMFYTFKLLLLKNGRSEPATVMILSFGTGRSGQTMQTLIRGAVWSGSTLFAIYTVCSTDPDQTAPIRVYTVCNSICIFWMHYSTVKPSCLNFSVITANF